MVLPRTVKFAPAVMGAVEENTVAALIASVLMPVLPRTVLPKALNALPLVIVTAALAVMGAVAVKVVTALTVRVWLLLAPNTTLALAVMGAVEAKVVTAFTVRA